MKLLITGICGFVGSTLAHAICEHDLKWDLVGIDNLIRPGSEENRRELKRLGVDFHHGDIRQASDFEALPACDWILDAAANPSVLAGVDGSTSSRQLVEHNLLGTVNLLECAKRWRAGFILLSTSRVYSMPPLANLPVVERDGAYTLDESQPLPAGVTARGISEEFSTAAPVSLYGATKLASETLSLEYARTFDLPCWINRCGVLAGGGQFGRADQGIFAYWIHSHLAKRSLRYIGFGGSGHQVRDCLHPRDLLSLIQRQIAAGKSDQPAVANVSGGLGSAMSLRQLTAWCEEQFGQHTIAADAEPRLFDLPWVVLDSSRARNEWRWQPETRLADILQEISQHARRRPEWLEISDG